MRRESSGRGLRRCGLLIVVVNTCEPFQTSDYGVARACIEHRVHYVDLADGRDFVTGIMSLDGAAKRAGVTTISGASTVPGLSSAVVEHYVHEFAAIDELVFGISPGQKAERGLATTEGILTYVGKRLKPFAGSPPTAPMAGSISTVRTIPNLAGGGWRIATSPISISCRRAMASRRSASRRGSS